MDLMAFLGTVTEFRDIKGPLRIACEIHLYPGGESL